MFERRFVALVAALVVVGGAVAYFLLRNDDGGAVPVDAPGLAGTRVTDGNVADYFDDGEDVLLYKSGSVVLERDLPGGRERELAEVDADAVFPAPGSPWLAYYRTPSKKPGETVLRLLNTENEDTVEIRHALGPVWSPDGSRLAYLMPADPVSCRSLAQCGSELTVEVWDAEDEDSSEVPGASAAGIVAWSGSALLVHRDVSETAPLTAVGPDGTAQDLDVTLQDFVSASPDGRWLLVREDGALRLEPTGSGPGAVVEMERFELSSATWTHDSRQVLAIASPSGSGRNDDDLAQLVRFSVDEPTPELFEESYGVFGDVMWAPSNDYVGFGRELGGAFPEFVYCPVAEGDCVSLMTYGEGTFPLRLQ